MPSGVMFDLSGVVCSSRSRGSQAIETNPIESGIEMYSNVESTYTQNIENIKLVFFCNMFVSLPVLTV